jgi:hypothetical protein
MAEVGLPVKGSSGVGVGSDGARRLAQEVVNRRMISVERKAFM